MKLQIAVLPGDGIGPEVTEQAIKVLKAIAFNSDNIEDYLYDVKKDNENYGAITNGNLVESSEKNKVLSQKGAKIINSLLQKQNTYWGE